MNDDSDGVMIALLPINSDWCRIDLPHMTLVYAGVVRDQRPNTFNTLAKDAAAIAMNSPIITLRVMAMDVFGDEEKVDVLRLRNTPELMAMRHSLEQWNASDHPFNPHVAIGPAGEGEPGTIPGYVAFDRIAVCYGPEMMTFWLKRY